MPGAQKQAFDACARVVGSREGERQGWPAEQAPPVVCGLLSERHVTTW